VLARAETVDPNIAQIYVNRGGVYTLLGNNSAAIKEFHRALSIEPNNRQAREALHRMGQ